MEYVVRPPAHRVLLRPQICIFIGSLRIAYSHVSQSTEYIFVFVSLLIKAAAVKENFKLKLYLWLPNTRKTTESRNIENENKSTKGLRSDLIRIQSAK